MQFFSVRSVIKHVLTSTRAIKDILVSTVFHVSTGAYGTILQRNFEWYVVHCVHFDIMVANEIPYGENEWDVYFRKLTVTLYRHLPLIYTTYGSFYIATSCFGGGTSCLTY